MSSVADNYGSRWVKAISNWFRDKTIEGYDKDMLIRDALLECGLRKNKTIEIFNEFVEMGLIKIKNNMLYWGEFAPLNIEMIPYRKAKEELQKEEKEIKTPNVLLSERQKALYEMYVNNCKNDKEEPMTYDAWITEKRGEIEDAL